jgi:hypothetical protein
VSHGYNGCLGQSRAPVCGWYASIKSYVHTPVVEFVSTVHMLEATVVVKIGLCMMLQDALFLDSK